MGGGGSLAEAGFLAGRWHIHEMLDVLAQQNWANIYWY